MAAREQRNQHAVHDLGLAHDGLGNLPANFLHLFGKRFSLLPERVVAFLSFHSY